MSTGAVARFACNEVRVRPRTPAIGTRVRRVPSRAASAGRSADDDTNVTATRGAADGTPPQSGR